MKAFLLKYKLQMKVELDLNKYFNLLYNLKQEKKSIAHYINEAQLLYNKCSEHLKEILKN